MKVLVALGICSLLVAVDCALDPALVKEFKEAMKKNLDNCASEVGASPDDVNTLTSMQMPASHEGKCILFCIHKIFNVQKPDGSLDKDGALTTIEVLKDMDADMHQKVSDVFHTCFSAPFDADPCIFAANLAECGAKESKKLGMNDALFH